MEAALFVTCLADTFFPDAARATLRVLEKLGYKVACPPGQTCCGQPMFNAGYFEQALPVAKHFLEVFEETSGPIIAPSSSCAAMVRVHYPRLFQDDPALLERAARVGGRVFELCEFLCKELNADLSRHGARFEDSVTFHMSCHFRALEVRDEPIRLIKQIAGIEYIPLEKMEECCGFGGTFSVNFPHISERMAADKLECIRKTGAKRLIFADPGCAVNILGYAHRRATPLKAMHIAELIDGALGG